MALDTSDKVCKQFKLDRIGEVLEMNKPFEFESLHQKNQSDIFGFTGDASTWITLHLTLRAYLLLREEFPLAVPYIEKKADFYLFHGPVANFEGAGRFVLGLMDEIKIAGPDSFRIFLDAKVNARLLNKE
jgi:proteasome accessory factor C